MNLPVPLRDLADSWASMYANSAWLRSGLAFAHVGALVGGGGCALAADRLTLRAFRRGPRATVGEVEHLHGVHRVVLIGLTIVLVSGVFLLLADVDAYLEAPAFWIKMALVAGLFFNGAYLVRSAQRVEAAAPGAATALRRASWLSVMLWFATTFLGAALPNVL